MAVQFKATSDFDAVVKDYERLQQENVKLREKMKGVSSSVKEQKSETETFFDSQFAQLSTLAFSWASVEGAIQFVGSAIQFTREETELAVDSMDRLFESRRRLAQVSRFGGDLDDLDKKADEFARQHGVSRESARDIMFDARSLSVESALPDIFRYSPVLDPSVSTTAAGKLPSIFDNQINEIQALNLTFSAARESALSFEDLMASIPTAAQGVSLAGGGAVETAALVSVLSEQTSDKAEAGQLMKSFGVKVGIDRQLFPEKHGVLAAFEQLRDMKPEDRAGFLKENQELNVAYQKIEQNYARIREREASLQLAVDTAGTADSPLERARLAVFDPSTTTGQQNRADLERRKSEIHRDVARTNRFGVGGALRAAAFDSTMASLDEAQVNLVSKTSAWLSAGAVSNTPLMPSQAVEPVGFAQSYQAERGLRQMMKMTPLGAFAGIADFMMPSPSLRAQSNRQESLSQERSLEVQQESKGFLSEMRDSLREIVGMKSSDPSHRETR